MRWGFFTTASLTYPHAHSHADSSEENPWYSMSGSSVPSRSYRPGTPVSVHVQCRYVILSPIAWNTVQSPRNVAISCAASHSSCWPASDNASARTLRYFASVNTSFHRDKNTPGDVVQTVSNREMARKTRAAVSFPARVALERAGAHSSHIT